MKRADISNMTEEQAADELAFREFEKLLRTARRKAVAAKKAEREVFDVLGDMCIADDMVPTNAENANNLLEAICCYIQYGEYSVAGIMREVKAAYGQQE